MMRNRKHDMGGGRVKANHQAITSNNIQALLDEFEKEG